MAHGTMGKTMGQPWDQIQYFKPWDFGLMLQYEWKTSCVCVIWLVFSTDIQLEQQPGLTKTLGKANYE